MIAWPDNVIEDIARRRAVIFVGAGVSKHGCSSDGQRPPTWAEFLREGSERVSHGKKAIQSLIKSGDYLTACEILKNQLDDQWQRFLRDKFVTPRYEWADIHKNIFNLDCNIVLTPNFDTIYETAASYLSNGTVTFKHYYDGDLDSISRGSPDMRAVVKVHGSIHYPDYMVFTRKDYANARVKYQRFYQFLQALLLTHTFVFWEVGCQTLIFFCCWRI